MAASYPGATAVFPARSDGQTIFSQHINALQDEIVAIESTLTATASGGVPSPLVVSGVRASVVLDWPAAGVLKSRFFAGASGPAAVLACNLNFDNGTAWLLDDVTQPGALVQVTPAGVLNFFTAPLGAGARALVLPFHTDITGVYERQRAAAMGDWTTIAFNAANFTCAPGMTWTVVAGGQNTYQYAMVGKSVVLAFDITGTIGGTPAAYVNVALPFAASKGFIQPVWAQNGIGVGTLSGSLINVYRDPGLGVVYTAGAMRVAGVITFPSEGPMAQTSYVNQVLAGFPADQRKALQLAFEYVLTNLRFGQPDDRQRAENLQLYYFNGQTAAVANAEFTIAHGLAAEPYNMIQVLPLQVVGSQIVPLRVTRRADTNRIYLSSSVVNAPITIALEV